MDKGWVDFIKKNPWPAAILAVCAVWYLTRNFATKDDLNAAIEKHHPTVDTKVEVHDTSIDTLFTNDQRLEKDIRELRSSR